MDYDSVSNNGYYTRLKEDEFIVWGKTITDEQREFRYRSVIVMPGRTLKFKGKWHHVMFVLHAVYVLFTSVVSVVLLILKTKCQTNVAWESKKLWKCQRLLKLNELLETFQ